jgi:hypothetical protein
MGCTPARHGRAALQLHTVVEPPLTRAGTGRISCRPIGLEPIAFEWTPRPPTLDATGSEALDVAPGRYRIVAVDAAGARADVVVDVAPALDAAVVITEYRVTPASTSRARDGSVEAVGAGVGDGWRFLWTHGVETEGPWLRDVPCGVYAAVALAARDEDDAPVVVHRCAPARVTVHAEPPGGGGRWDAHAKL